MPTYRERLEALMGGRPAPSASQVTPPSPGMGSGLPTLDVNGTPMMMVPSGRGFRLQPVPQSPEQKLEEARRTKEMERQVSAENPVPTESERERQPLVRNTASFLDDFAKEIGIDEAKQTVTHAKELAASRGVLPQFIQEYVQGSKTKKIYNTLDSALTLGALVLTGRQGDVQKLNQLKELYQFGQGIQDQPDVIIQRYKNMKKLFSSFDQTYKTPEERDAQNAEISKQMDTMMREADPVKAGGQLRQDKHGRQAYVFPDGSYQLVK